METFGEKLRAERERAGLTVETVAERVGLDRERLLALEANEFDALPDVTVMTGHLREYADCLEVDSDLMIEDYLRERERCLRQLADAIPEPAWAPAPEATPALATPVADRPSGLPRSIIAVTAVVLLAIVAGWWLLSGDGGVAEPGPVEVPVETPASSETTTAAPADATPPVAAAPSATEPKPTPTPAPPVLAAGISVDEHGVGSGVANRRLVDERTRFTEGSEVWYWTEVTGGSRGDRIDHVWLQDGVERARISLRVGGPRWRTQSSKTMHAGSAGDWAVEARDAAGQVLSRGEFVCVP